MWWLEIVWWIFFEKFYEGFWIDVCCKSYYEGVWWWYEVFVFDSFCYWVIGFWVG